MTSVGSILEAALSSAKLGRRVSYPLSSALSAAQVGAAFKAKQIGALVTGGEAHDAVESFGRLLKSTAFHAPYQQSLREFHTTTSLEEAVGFMFDDPIDVNVSLLGYWVASQYVRGIRGEEIDVLTTFLAGPKPRVKPDSEFLSIRRYPTGGISEKQALILPVLLKHFAGRGNWQSDFLIAGLLSFTGGTRAKLSVVPGFRTFPPSSDFARVARPRVAYISAGVSLCPRDALLYRIRSETGTVVDLGLMASSIMSKQVAAPSDIVLLDILYGDGAFLNSLAQANEFGKICEELGQKNGLKVYCITRATAGTLGHCIGASTEILEAAITISSSTLDDLQKREFDKALDFLSFFAEMCGLDVEAIRNDANSARLSGQLFATMVDLWRDHGAENSWLMNFTKDQRACLMAGLETRTFEAPSDGKILGDAISIADFVNTEINVVTSRYGEEPTVRRGGVILHKSLGSTVKKDQKLLTIISEPNIRIDVSRVWELLNFTADQVNR